LFVAKNRGYFSRCNVYSSRLWRFNYGREKDVVNHPLLGHVGAIKSGLIPKTAGNIGAEIYNKILSAPDTLGSLINKTGKRSAFYHSAARYWIKAYDFTPFFSREGESDPGKSTKLKELPFESEFEKNVFILLVNSSLFYYWWMVVGDEFDVLRSEINEFHLPLESFYSHKDEVTNLVSMLMKDYKENAIRKNANVGNVRIAYDEFYPRKSLRIISEIDALIADLYGLSDLEAKFVSTYDHEFRTDNE